MQIIDETEHDGVSERLFELEVGDESVPGVIWSPIGLHPGRPILLMGHGGGQQKKYPGIVSQAHKYVTSLQVTAVAIDAPGHGDREPSELDLDFVAKLRKLASQGESVGELVADQNARLAQIAVPEWQATLDAVLELDSTGGSGPVGYWGVSMGGAIGVHLIAEEPKIKTAVIGLVGLIPTDHALAKAAARASIPIEFVLQWHDQLVPRETSLALFDSFGSRGKVLHANPGGHTEIPPFERESWERFLAWHLWPAK